MIQTKDESQGKLDRKLDRKNKPKKKFIPLIERDFNDLITLSDQLKWVELRKQRNNKFK